MSFTISGPTPGLTSTTATISSGTSLSAGVTLAGQGLVRLNMPTGWDAAVLTFQTSPDNGVYQNMYDATGTEYTVQVAAAHNVILSPADFVGINYIKVRSGTSGAAVTQSADRALLLIGRVLA